MADWDKKGHLEKRLLGVKWGKKFILKSYNDLTQTYIAAEVLKYYLVSSCIRKYFIICEGHKHFSKNEYMNLEI